ncbi:MAG: YceI family protein [Cyclobacteriaceae bacterium]|nr:YceI family protein [Cyclobacteriaceae bacterium]
MKALYIVFLLLPIAVFGQKFVIKEKLNMEVLGTSNLHDWEMISHTGVGEATIILSNGKLKNIESLVFKLNTESLKSGKSTMDEICYKAMKTDKHKTISFVLKEVKSISNSDNKYKIIAAGNLTIAGTTKYQTLTVTADFSSKRIVFTGLHNIKMTDFNVKPPTALFGTIRTGDDLNIKFEVIYTDAESLALMNIPD